MYQATIDQLKQLYIIHGTEYFNIQEYSENNKFSIDTLHALGWVSKYSLWKIKITDKFIRQIMDTGL